MAVLDKLQATDNLVEGKKRDAEALYNDAAKVPAGDNDWLEEQRKKINAATGGQPVQKTQQPEQTGNSQWLNEQQKKIDNATRPQSPARGYSDAERESARQKAVSYVTPEQPEQRRPQNVPQPNPQRQGSISFELIANGEKKTQEQVDADNQAASDARRQAIKDQNAAINKKLKEKYGASAYRAYDKDQKSYYNSYRGTGQDSVYTFVDYDNGHRWKYWSGYPSKGESEMRPLEHVYPNGDVDKYDNNGNFEYKYESPHLPFISFRGGKSREVHIVSAIGGNYTTSAPIELHNKITDAGRAADVIGLLEDANKERNKKRGGTPEIKDGDYRNYFKRKYSGYSAAQCEAELKRQINIFNSAGDELTAYDAAFKSAILLGEYQAKRLGFKDFRDAKGQPGLYDMKRHILSTGTTNVYDWSNTPTNSKTYNDYIDYWDSILDDSGHSLRFYANDAVYKMAQSIDNGETVSPTNLANWVFSQLTDEQLDRYRDMLAERAGAIKTLSMYELLERDFNSLVEYIDTKGREKGINWAEKRGERFKDEHPVLYHLVDSGRGSITGQLALGAFRLTRGRDSYNNVVSTFRDMDVYNEKNKSGWGEAFTKLESLGWDLPLIILTQGGSELAVGGRVAMQYAAPRVISQVLTMSGISEMGLLASDFARGEFSPPEAHFTTLLHGAASGALLGFGGELGLGLSATSSNRILSLWGKAPTFAAYAAPVFNKVTSKGIETMMFSLPEFAEEVYSGRGLSFDKAAKIVGHNAFIIGAMGLKNGEIFKGWGPKMPPKEIAKLREAGYGEIADSIEKGEFVYAEEFKDKNGKTQLRMRVFGQGENGAENTGLAKELERLIEDQSGNNKGLPWDTFQKVMNMTAGCQIIPPIASKVDVKEEGGKYYVQMLDNAGRVIAQDKGIPVSKKAKMEKMRAEAEDKVAAQKALQNVLQYELSRETSVEAEALSRFAEKLNGDSDPWLKNEDGSYALDENGNRIVDPNSNGYTAETAAFYINDILEVPEAERTPEQKQALEDWKTTYEDADESLNKVDKIKEMVCRQFGVSVEAFDATVKKRASKRDQSSKATQAVEAFNAIMEGGVIDTNKVMGRVTTSSGEVLDVYSVGGTSEGEQRYYYKDGDGALKMLSGDEVTDFTPVSDDRTRLFEAWDTKNKAAAEEYAKIVEEHFNAMSPIQLRESISELERAIAEGEEGADIEEFKYQLDVAKRVLEEKGSQPKETTPEGSQPLTDREKAELVVQWGAEGGVEYNIDDLLANPEKLNEYYEAMTGGTKEEPAAEAEPSQPSESVTDLLNVFGFTGQDETSVAWQKHWTKNPPRDKYDVLLDFLNVTDAAKREELRVRWENNPSNFDLTWRNTVGDKVNSTDVERTLTELKYERPESMPSASSEVAASETYPEHRPTVSDAKPEEMSDEAIAAEIEAIRDYDRDERTVSMDNELVARRDALLAEQQRRSEEAANPSQPTETPQPENERKSAEVETSNGASAPQDNTATPPKVEEKPAVEKPTKEKIDELLDFLELDKDDPIARKVFTDDPEYFNEEWTAYQEEKAKLAAEEEAEKKAEEAAKKDEVVDDSPQEPEIVDDLDAPMPTKKVNGKDRPDYSRTTPRKGWDYVYNKMGLNQETADKIVKKGIDAAKKALEAHSKKEPEAPSPDEIDEYKEKYDQWEQERERLEAEQKYWEEVQNISKLTSDIKEIEEAKSFTSRRDVFNKMRRKYASDPAMRAYSEVRNFVPQNLYDACVHYLASGVRFVWNAEGTRRGLKQQTGWGDGERKKLIGMLSNDGVTPDKAVHEIVDAYGEDLGIDLTQSQEVLNTLIDAISSTGSVGEAHDYIRSRLLEEMRDELTKRVEGKKRGSYDTDADRYYDDMAQQYRDEHPELKDATDEEVFEAMSRERNTGGEERVETVENPDETGVNDDFFENGGEDVPFQKGETVKPEQPKTKQARNYTARTIKGLRKAGVNVKLASKEEAESVAAENREGTTVLTTEDGTIYGWHDSEGIHLTEEGFNPDTPLHEYTHGFMRMLKETDPKTYSRVVEGLKESELWQEVLNDEAYKDIHNDETAVASEVAARLSGRENASRVNTEFDRENIISYANAVAVGARVKNALRTFWDNIAEWFGAKLDKAMPADRFARMTLRALEKGVNPDAAIEGNVDAEMMGSRTDKRMAEIGKFFEGKDLTETQRAVVDVYSGNTSKNDISVSRNDGTRTYEIMQGSEPKAGTKHSVFRHYNTNDNYITTDDIIKIPDIIKNGDRIEEDNGNISYSLKYGEDTLTFVTRPKGGKERMVTFYSDREAPKTLSQNTPNGARTNASDALSSRKDTPEFSAVQENGGKTTESSGEQRFKVGNTWYGRDKTYGVGKKIGGRVYVHKDYAERVVPKDVLDKAKAVAEKEGFSYNCINYDPKNPNVVRFDEAPDFDTAREPITGRFIYVDANTGEVIKTGSSNQIWHHKWQWVAPDYKGFDVQKSYEWSKRWTQKMTHPSGYRDKWDAALREAGLPVDGEGGEFYRTSEELNEQYPTWLSGQTKESGKHSTQIPGTLSSYNRIGDWMKKNGMEGVSVLDASSGLGYGTRALREQGFNVDDVEPYPDKSREAPTYSKYEDIDKEYDVVISNAVLNVIPDDWRADVLKSMADKLKVGGKLIINVRDAKSIEGQKQKIELDSPSEILVTDKKGNITAYQKGFTKKELQDWVKSELGEGWDVEIANENNSGLKSGVAVVVTRGEGAAPVRYRSFEPIGERGVKKVTQVREPEYREATDYFGNPTTLQTRSAEYKVEGMDDTFYSVEEAADAVRRRNPDYCVYIDNEGNIRLEAWSNLLPEGVKPNSFAKVIAMSGGEMSSAMKKRIANFAKREMDQARKEAEALTQQLGLDVEFHDDPNEFEGRKAKAKGWYDTKTGKIHVVMGNHSGVGDVMATMLHEGVAHHGLRKLFGSDFDTFLDNVHDNVGKEIRAEIDGRIDKMRAADEKNGETHSDDYYRRAATEEYIAELAEDGLYNAEKHGSYAMRAWEWIKEKFLDMLRKRGFNMELSDDELRYTLWKSHQNLRQNAVEMAKDAVLKDKAGIKDYVEEGEPVKTVAEGEVRDGVSQYEDNTHVGEERYRDGEEGGAPTSDLAARMRERMRERMERARAAMAANNGGGERGGTSQYADSADGTESRAEGTAPRTEIGGAGNGEPPTEPPTPPSTPAPEPTPELPPTDFDRPMTPIEMAQEAAIKTVTDTKASLEQRNAARRELTASLRNIHKAMRIQKEYDRATVENVVNLCKMMVQSGLIDRNYVSNLTPLFTKLKDTTGKQDLTSTVNDIMDVMLKSQERSVRNEIAKLLNTKGTKVDQNGVVTQAGLDIRGQHTMKELSEYMGKGSVIIDNHIAKLEEERAKIPDGHQERIDDIDDKILGSQLAKQFSQIEETHSVNIREAEQDLDFLKERYKAGEIGVKEYTEQKHALENLIRSYRMAQADALWNQANAIRYVIAGGKEGTRNWIEQQKERKNEIRHNAYSDMEGTSKQTQGDPTMAQKVMNMSIPKFFSSSLYTLQTMLKSLGNKHAMGEGYLYNRFFRGWMEQRDAEITEYRDDMNVLNAKAKELTGHSYFGIYNMIQKLPKMTVEYMDGGEMLPHELDQGQLGYAYMVNKMEDGAAALRNMGITEEKMQEISNFLDPKLKEFYDWLQDDFLAGKWDGMNEVHRRMFGADMDRVANYIPLRRDREAGTQKVDISQENEQPLQSTVVGSIIQRVHSNLGIDLKHSNAIDVVANHLLESTHWKHFSEWKRDANTLLSDTTFRNKVKNSTTIYGSGKILWERLNQVFQIAGGDYKPKAHSTGVDKAIVDMARTVNTAKVSMRVFTATKQLLSLPVFATECNTFTLLKNLGFLLSPVASKNVAQNSFLWCMQNLPQFRERWVSRTAGETRLENGDLGWGYSRQKVLEAAGRIGLTPNAFIDVCTVAAGAKSIYEKRFAQYKKDGYSVEAADKKAKIDAETAFNESQQSSEKAFVSPIQVDRTAVALGLSTFRNASMGFERKFIDAIRNFRHLTDHKETVGFMKKQMVRDGLTEVQAEKAAERVYRRAIWRSVLNTLMFGFGAQMAWNVGGKLPYLIFGDDDEEKKKVVEQAAIHAGIGGWIEGLPVGDMLSEGMTNWAMNLIESGNPLEGNSFFEFDPDLLTVTSDFVKMTKALEGKNPLKGATDFVNLLAQIYTGVNPQTFTDAGVAIYDACDGNPEVGNEALMCILRIMQCPQSQLDQMYIDELKMSAREAQNLTPEEVARRYAYYKAHKETPYLWWMYNQSKRDEIVKKYEDDFTKKLNTDVKEEGATPEDYRDLMRSATTTGKHKDYQKKYIGALSEQGLESLRKAWEEEPDQRVKDAIMDRYIKDMEGKEKEDPNSPYTMMRAEDEKEKAHKIGNMLGFDAELKYHNLSGNVTNGDAGHNKTVAKFREIGGDGVKCMYKSRGKDAHDLSIEEGGWTWPKNDAAKAAKCKKYYDEHKDELERIYRSNWRSNKIDKLMKETEEYLERSRPVLRNGRLNNSMETTKEYLEVKERNDKMILELLLDEEKDK